MKKSTLVIGVIVAFIVGYAGGHYMKDTTILMEDYVALGSTFSEVAEVEEEEEEKDCSAEVLEIRNELENTCQEVTEIRKGQWNNCQPKECDVCDCTIDFDDGVIEGKRQSVEESRMYSGSKKKTEYCDEHYCQEKILRRTRPISE